MFTREREVDRNLKVPVLPGVGSVKDAKTYGSMLSRITVQRPGSTLLPELLRDSGGEKYLTGFTTRDDPLAWPPALGRGLSDGE
jgi:hypothetical protein